MVIEFRKASARGTTTVRKFAKDYHDYSARWVIENVIKDLIQSYFLNQFLFGKNLTVIAKSWTFLHSICLNLLWKNNKSDSEHINILETQTGKLRN